MLKELGRYLKITRIENGVSIEEAADDLKIEEVEIENIEAGNVKAFKDIYELRHKMQTYAKYLGLDSDKVADEFNEFLFAHTSKISLKDIEEEQAKQEATKEVKMHSPYTKEYKKKINYKPILIGVGVLILLLVL
ncbi:MAG: helix-turn-helix domain-containing protein, partial [Bacilli bacterium]|nr:helix-turn-helix domain-containing protein [Bacilli bacterium]